MKEYKYPIIKERINNKDVSIVGVVHNNVFFEKNKDFFEDIISQYDTTILEGVAQEEVRELPWYIDKESYIFFKNIGNIALNRHKRIYQVDPGNFYTSIADDASTFVGITLAIIGADPIKFSRRSFLKRFGLISGGLSLFLGTSTGQQVIDAINVESLHRYGIDDLHRYGIDDLLTYGVLDYRNLTIAEGIEKICNKIDDINSIVSIHGATHYKTVDMYLKNPNLRKKKLAYLPFNILGNTKIREYIPDKDGWKLARKF